MTLELNSVEIVDLALLKFRAPINRCHRWQPRPFGPIFCSHPEDDRTVFELHRIEVVNRFQVSWKRFALRFVHLLLHSLDNLFHFDLLRHRAIEPINSSHVRTKIEAQSLVLAQKRDHGTGMFMIKQKRWLIGRTGIWYERNRRAGNSCFNPAFNYFERFHSSKTQELQFVSY